MSETPDTPRSGERIAKLLARAGIASRREVERMIAEGRVRIGDEVLTTPATVLENLKGVTVDGKPVGRAEATRLFVFHKPSGLITAERDPAGRPTIYTALRNALPPGTPRMMPVGRLDLNTEGLLLLTNDGELKRALELPSSGIPRTYRARTFGDITQAMLEELMIGVEIDGFQYGSINANIERSTGHNRWIELTLTEGKNREVRRVLEHLGLQVSRLIRLAYGPFVLGDLPRGAVYEVRQADVEQFCKAMKVPGAVAALPQHAARAAPRAAPVRAPVRAPVEPARESGRRHREERPRPAGDAPRRPFGRNPERSEARSAERPARPFAVKDERASDQKRRRPDARPDSSPKRIDAAARPRRARRDDDAGPLLHKSELKPNTGPRRPGKPGGKPGNKPTGPRKPR